MDRDKELKGVRGWLLVLLLVLIFPGPLWRAWRTFSQWEGIRHASPEYASSSEFALLHAIAWFAFVLSSALGFWAGYLLWKKHVASSVRIAIRCLWLMGPIISVIGYILALALTGESPVLADLRTFIGPTVSAGIWTAYLLMSRRVKNTYAFDGRLLGAVALDGIEKNKVS